MSIIDFSKSIDMLQVANLISRCWDEITPLTLRHSWRKIFAEPGSKTNSSEESASTSELVGNQEEQASGSDVSTSEPQEHQAMDIGSEFEVCCTFHRLGFNLSEAETFEWLNCDLQDRGYAHLTDEEIITTVIQNPNSEEQPDDDKSDEEFKAATRVSHAEAEKMFDQCIKWLQDQEEASQYNVRVLQELSELAARKRFNMLKQRKLSDYFNVLSSSSN